MSYNTNYTHTYVTDEVKKESDSINEQLIQLKNRILKLPKGTLSYSKTGKYIKWYKFQDGKKEYLPSQKKEIIHNLIKKRYLEGLIEDLEHEKYALDVYLEYHRAHVKHVDEMLQEKSVFQPILNDTIYHLPRSLKAWRDKAYKKSDSHKENLKHKTATGEFVRSKSESLIANTLFYNNIPYHYEEELEVGGYKVSPDFTIRHPKTGKIYYWEHLGMLNLQKYRSDNWWKLDLYIKNGYIPSVNLILTYETEDKPVNAEHVLHVVQEYFL